MDGGNRMSTEIDELEKRVAAVEKSLAGRIATELARNPLNAMCADEPAPGSDAEHPPVGYRLAKVGDLRAPGYIWWDEDDENWETESCMRTGLPVKMGSGHIVANPIPANKGDSRLAESAAIPVGWIDVAKAHYGLADMSKALDFHSVVIVPDPSIPWGEGYEAILPSEAEEGDEYLGPSGTWWTSGCAMCNFADPKSFAWRRRIPATTPTEPARDLSAEVETQKKLDLQWEAAKALEEERNALIGDLSELRATVDRLEAENAELRNRNEGLQGAMDERKMRVRELMDQESSLREKIARIREVAG